MRFRIDFTLMPNARLNIFRQNLINDNSTPIKMSITNLTKGELIRGFKNLIGESDFYCDNKILKKGANGIVDLCIYDTPRKIPLSRNVTFSSLINAKDYVYKILDTNEIDKDSNCYFDSSIDISQYLALKGNPNNIGNEKLAKEVTEEPIKESVEEPELIQEEAEEVVGEEPMIEPNEPMIQIEIEPKNDIESEDLKVTNKNNEVIFEINKEDKVNEDKVETEEKKYCCPVEGCGKEYSTKKGYKSHMKKVHGIEV